MTVSALPILVVDLMGAILMIVLSFMCLGMAARLQRRAPDEILWTYLWWLCLGLAGFALSRSAGHILRQVLILTGQRAVWQAVSPYSGAFNTLIFAVVASVTLYFERVWSAYRQILADKCEIQSAHRELIYLNQNLETLVAERTEALAGSEHKYRRIFELSRDIVVVTTPEGRILDLNPAGYDTLGGNDASRSTPVGDHISRLLADDGDWERLRAAIDSSGFVTNAEVLLQRPDGSRRLALINSSLDRSGAGTGTVHLLIKDIEQRLQMEKQMAQADKLASVGEFSAGIAHEINNPMGIILGYAQLMLRGEAEGTERFRDLKTIEKHVRNCKAIVEDLLNFARSSQAQKESVGLHDLMDEVVGFIQAHSRAHGMTFDRDYDPQLPPIVLDQKKIRQVFINLIMNARHAMEEKGCLRLSTHFDSEARQAVIRVSDPGYGIEEKNLSRIFDPFFTTKPTGEGTGLGLSVSYGIIKNHGGDIQVESTPGQGAVFTITLPVGGGQDL